MQQAGVTTALWWIVANGSAQLEPGGWDSWLLHVTRYGGGLIGVVGGRTVRKHFHILGIFTALVANVGTSRAM